MNENVMNWLLEASNPAVRYHTLTRLLKKPCDSTEVIEARKESMEKGDIAKILEKQNKDGSWDDSTRFYRAKYKGTVWTLLILSELGADSSDDRIKKACEFILNHSQEPNDGGFSVDISKKTGAGLPNYVIPCLTGNMVYSLIKFGYLDDPRVQNAIDWIVKYQRTDDGNAILNDEYHKKHPACFSAHSCHMGVAKSFKALMAIPLEKRSNEVKEKITQFANYFLVHHVFKKSHNLDEDSKPGWRKFGFPLMYQTDILELMGLFCDLEYQDDRLKDAIQVIKDKQLIDGTWMLENSYNGKTIINIEKKSKTSKWITLKALKVLDYYRQ